MNDQSLIRLSQSHLTLLETCPPQFQQLYLENLQTPMNPEQGEKLAWGSQFHLLMQQQELGLWKEQLDLENPSLNQSVQALLTETESIWQNPNLWREAEHHRTLTIQNYLLTVVYDLLILDKTHAHILDWKTYPKPEKKDKLAKSWQTRLYLYLLAETSSYLPKQISMTYWFVQLPEKPQSLTFKYDIRQHKRNHQDVNNLLNQLHHYLDLYDQEKLDFPHHINCQTRCPHAYLLSILDQEESLSQQLLQDIESVEEVII